MNITRIKQFLFAVLALCLSAWASADTYTYDKLNRLTAVSYSAGGGQTYTYDASGNRLSLASTPPSTGNFTLAVAVSGGGTVTSTPTGINCGTTCSASFASAAAVTLTATPATGSTFTGWSGACTGTASTCVVSMAASTNVTATFTSSTAGSVALSVTRTGTGSGSVISTPAGISCGTTCSASFSTGTSVNLTVAAATGSTFAGWSGACSGTGSCVVSMSDAKSVSASFTTTGTGTSLTYPLSLAQGWNMLGNSLNQALPVASVFGNAQTITTVWKWDVATSGWQFYTPSLDTTVLQTYAASKGYGVLSTINPGEGYWVNAKAATSLGTQTGTAFGLGAPNLVQGWNLSATGNNSTPSAFNRSLSASPPAAGTVPINLTSLWMWDTTQSKWFFYAPSLEAAGGTALGDHITSKGYLDFTPAGKTLGNGAGFWVNKP